MKIVVQVEYESDLESSENAQMIAESVIDRILRGKRKHPTKFTKERNISIQVLSESMNFEPIK